MALSDNLTTEKTNLIALLESEYVEQNLRDQLLDRLFVIRSLLGELIGSGGGGGGTGDASAANQTVVQANAGSDATKAIAIQGITGGKSIPVVFASAPNVNSSQSGIWSVGLTGTLPAFASTPTFNLGTAPNLTITNTAFTANAGTNLNTSLLALESGGNLAGINTKLPSGLTVSSNRLLVDFDNVTQPVNITNSSFVVDAGNNLNTSLLAVESGGNLSALNTTVGTQSSATVDVNTLFTDPYLSADAISLLKAIAVSNRQLTINSQVWGSGTLSNTNAGFDKSFTVPSNVTYHILFGNVQVVTNSTAGNRILKIEILNFDDSIIHQTYAITYQAASKTYNYSLSNSESSLLPDQNQINVQIPVSLILYAGQKIRVVLIGGVAGDELILKLQIGTR